MKKTIFLSLITLAATALHAQDNNGRYYSAGEIQSKTQVKYGRFEFKMYSSDMSGTTSTFFLWKEGSTEPNIQWNEIDVETFGKSANSWQSNPIWEYETNDYNPRRWEAFHNAIPIANKFVTFTVEWTPGYIAWYNNGTQVRRILKGQNAPQGNDPVGNIADAMRMCFNHWATFPGNWLGPFNPADLPSFQFVDWFTYQKWNGTGFDPVSIRNDFNNLAEVTTNYNISTHTFGDNQCTFRAANVGVVNGMLWLSITGWNNARPPAGNEIPNPNGTPTNTPPAVNITAPTSGASYASGSTITLTANATDAAPGTVSSVSFYDGATLLGTDASNPYSFTWNGAGVGGHSITARATDNNGATTTSAAVSITVATGSGNPLSQYYFHVVNKLTADYMRPTAGSATATIIQEEVAAVPTLSSFQWEFRAAPTSGYYFIVNKYTGNAIQPTGGSMGENTDLSQVALSGANQNNTELHWVVQASDEAPYYWIKNRKSGLYIRPNAGTNGTGIQIVQNTLNTTYSSFKWNLANQGDIPAANPAAEDLSSVVTDAGAQGITVYPNPAEGQIYITTEVKKMSSVTVSIYNMAGAVVSTTSFGKRVGWFRESMDIRSVSTGTYIVKIQKGDVTESKIFIRK
ncbi:MAG: family 16 glycosylhydrolase [Bacteroidota bacterium]